MDHIVYNNKLKPISILNAAVVLFLLYYTDNILFGSIAMLVAIFIEYMGCKVTKAWKYNVVSFLAIEIAYSVLSWFALRLVETILAINPLTPLELILISGFMVINHLVKA